MPFSVHAFQCNCSIIAFLCFAFYCSLKGLSGLDDLICSINGGAVNSVNIELLV